MQSEDVMHLGSFIIKSCLLLWIYTEADDGSLLGVKIIRWRSPAAIRVMELVFPQVFIEVMK